MNYERYIKEGLIKKATPDFKQIEAQLDRAQKDMKTADEIRKIDITWAYTIIYHALVRAGRALIYSKGHLPTAKHAHKTIVELTANILGPEYEALCSHFNRMRRRRNDFIYDAMNHISEQEAVASYATAKSLLDKIREIIETDNPQTKLGI